MKRLVTLLLTGGILLGSVAGALAIDFNISGSWDFYFNVGEVSMFKKPHDARHGRGTDVFDPGQRLRFQLDAVASENLSGTVMFELGTQWWGQDNGFNSGAGRGAGGALGTDGVDVAVLRAYIDWQVPNTELRVRMGLQNTALPNAAGGSAILDDETAALLVSYKISDHVSLLAGWSRPYNDNYRRGDLGGTDADGTFDNIDLGILAIPLSFDGFSATPWGMLGFAGKNAARAQIVHYPDGFGKSGGYVQRGLLPLDLAQGKLDGLGTASPDGRGPGANLSKTYATMFWAGIPVTITAFDPFNFELDANYGYTSGWGKYNDARATNRDGSPRRNDTRREGFVIKALAEYKMDWGIPGVFGWYGSGDDGNTRNGSERMPYLSPNGTFSSFGLAGYYGDVGNNQVGERIDTGYSGTWAFGAQIRDMSFLEDLSHTLRVIYWRGTNDPSMAKSVRNPFNPNGSSYDNVGWNEQPWSTVYLTKNDYLVEFNLDSVYKIYENLEACLELGYIINGVDKNTWKWSGNQKEDAWKISINFRYSF